jgi:hypothetical protein
MIPRGWQQRDWEGAMWRECAGRHQYWNDESLLPVVKAKVLWEAQSRAATGEEV